MCNRKPKPAHYLVSTDNTDRGDAFQDEGVARKYFERIAATGHFLRLLFVDGGIAAELDRRNGEQSMSW
jgi:hypothetical protein